MRFRMLCVLVLVSSFAGLTGRSDAARIERMRAWPTPSRVEAILLKVAAEMDTTLPAPTLYEEPPYTWGRTNTIFWDMEGAATLAASAGMELLFFECQAYFNETELWGFVDAELDSATFVDLPAGVTITYRIRYYAQDAQGNFGRSYWSNPVASIQDVSSPVIESLEIVGLQESGQKKWVNAQTIQIRVRATDPDSGKIMQVGYQETNATIDTPFLYDVEPPQTSIDRLIPYTIEAEEHDLITLNVWVVDVSGQTSEVHSESFFWWEYEEMVCFPNPFNPDRGEVSTITLNDSDISEARIFDMLGNPVRTLYKDPANSFFEWDGRNGEGAVVAKGGYVCVVEGNRRFYCKIAVWK